MTNKIVLLLSFLVSFAAIGTSQSLQDSLSNKLSIIASNLDVVGMSVVVVKKDSIIYSKGFGKRDVARNLPVDSNTIYRIASISKSFVATAVMQLCEQGQMKLSDDIGTLLGYQVRNPYFPNDTITISMLLTHTSSLTDDAGYSSISAIKSSSAFANKKPGSYFQYCNLGFSTLGAIVEKIANQRFDIYIRTNILIPFGMVASYYLDDFTADQFNNLSVLYRKTGSSWIPQADNYGGVKPAPRDFSNYKMGEDAFTFSPTGGLRTSAADLAKFMMAHMNKGIYKGIRILRDTSVQSMHTPKWIYNGSNGANEGFWNKYGYAFHTAEALIPGQLLRGVPGEAYGLLSDMYFSPDSLYGIVFITNGGSKFAAESNGFYNIENAVINAVYTILLYPIKPSTQDKSLNENFEISVPPAGWIALNFDGSESSAWSKRNTGKPSNSSSITGAAKIGYTESGILISKKVLIADTSKFLSYDYRKFCGSQYSSKMEIMISQGNVQTAINSFVSLKTYTRTNGRPAYSGSDATPSSWQSDTLDLSGYLGNDVFIAFKVDNTYDDGSGPVNTGDIWDLDDVKLIKNKNATQVKNGGEPLSFQLSQNYPNPFNPTTVISYQLPMTSRVRLVVYNLLGQVVTELVDMEQSAGWRNVLWKADVSSGLYFYRLEASATNAPGKRFVEVRKMMVMK